MALFGKKTTKKETKMSASTEEQPVVSVRTIDSVNALDLSWVLSEPRLTEKAAIKTSDNVYTFNVHSDANKIQIKQAVQALYKVKPMKIRIINNKPEKIFARGFRGTKKGFKKAMVFLKKGDTIEFV